MFMETLALPQKSKIVMQPYIDFLAGRYEQSHNGFHGLEHWLRFSINGRLIAAESGADLAVVDHFALIYDVMCENENEDMYHGMRSANLSQALSGDWTHLDNWQLNQQYEASQYHSMG